MQTIDVTQNEALEWVGDALRNADVSFLDTDDLEDIRAALADFANTRADLRQSNPAVVEAISEARALVSTIAHNCRGSSVCSGDDDGAHETNNSLVCEIERRLADAEAALSATHQPRTDPGDDFDWRKAAINLAMREADYRINHDVHGDGSREAGRSWDRMRHSGNAIRAAVFRKESEGSNAGAIE